MASDNGVKVETANDIKRNKPAGDAKRLMSTARADSLGFRPEISLEAGIAETLAWYRAHRGEADLRYNAFTDATYAAS